MSGLAFILVLSSTFLHATWNFYAKKFTFNKVVLVCVAWLFAGITLLPLSTYLLWKEGMSATGAGFILASSIIHAFYTWFLGAAYEKGDISIVYPISRGTGIAGTALIATSTGIDSVSSNGFLGILLILSGIVCISFHKSSKSVGLQSYLPPLFVGVTISLYSVVDKLAVTHVTPLLYMASICLGSSIFVLPFLSKKMGEDLSQILTYHKRYAFFVGIAGFVAYCLVLAAFKLSQASYVVALREVSIVIATFLGISVLKEEASPQKILGVLLIISGAVAVKFA